MKVEVYECQYCGKLHKDEGKYKKCVAKCEKTKLTKDEEVAQAKARQELSDYVRLNAESIEDICKLTEEVSKKIHGKSFIRKLILNVRYCEHASNSHSAPIGKERNWSGKEPGVPTGYPALRGTIKFIYNKDPGSGSSCGIRGLNTGSGGYAGSTDGSYNLEYGVTLWLDDFPKIKEKVDSIINQCDHFESLKYEVEKEVNKKISEDIHIIDLKSEISCLETQIMELQIKANQKRGKIWDIEKTYVKPKQEILDKEFEKLKNDFGVGLPDRYIEV